jgi:hypothetical protein
MKFLQYLIFFVATAISTDAFARVEFRPLAYFSKKQAAKFLEEVRKNSISNERGCVIKFKLHSRKNENLSKIGEIIFHNPQEYSLSFEGQPIPIQDLPIDEPFFDGLIFSPRDLSIIFANGDDYSYDGPIRVSNRPAQQFFRKIPQNDKFSSVEVSIDGKFLIVLRAEFFGDDGKVCRQFSVGSFKNFGEVWMPKIIDFCDSTNPHGAKIEILSVEFVK